MTLTGGTEETLLLVSLYFFGKIWWGGGGGAKAIKLWILLIFIFLHFRVQYDFLTYLS